MRHTILVVLTLILSVGSLIGYSYKSKKWERVFAAVICVVPCIIWQIATQSESFYPLTVGGLAILTILFYSWKREKYKGGSP